MSAWDQHLGHAAARRASLHVGKHQAGKQRTVVRYSKANTSCRRPLPQPQPLLPLLPSFGAKRWAPTTLPRSSGTPRSRGSPPPSALRAARQGTVAWPWNGHHRPGQPWHIAHVSDETLNFDHVFSAVHTYLLLAVDVPSCTRSSRPSRPWQKKETRPREVRRVQMQMQMQRRAGLVRFPCSTMRAMVWTLTIRHQPKLTCWLKPPYALVSHALFPSSVGQMGLWRIPKYRQVGIHHGPLTPVPGQGTPRYGTQRACTRLPTCLLDVGVGAARSASGLGWAGWSARGHPSSLLPPQPAFPQPSRHRPCPMQSREWHIIRGPALRDPAAGGRHGAPLGLGSFLSSEGVSPSLRCVPKPGPDFKSCSP
ncbi:hypothetical protein B0T11DRAFT_270832 [Plectosphaerella cucumerina]|uniref:Uncharacterized protein n=1 Tax=Plectosphaerella cucumerina TaxID=40658 RepID=A0A8K0XA33_9PEZI|nr:hypothetical protein B0T11DRAFT_270832 [Plectosphaerella cucumerina]